MVIEENNAVITLAQRRMVLNIRNLHFLISKDQIKCRWSVVTSTACDFGDMLVKEMNFGSAL